MKRVKLYMSYVLFIGFVVTLGLPVQSTAREPQGLSTSMGAAEPVAQLPEHVLATDGRLTLFADFGDVRGDRVVLYLINRTSRRIGFSAQDGDPYVKLEALSESGQWERAQEHVFDWCGNSYVAVPALSPGEFSRFLGYYPAEGEPRVVRYRVFHESAYILKDQTPAELKSSGVSSKDAEKMPLSLVSNEGHGRVRLSDIAEARYDQLAIRFGSFDAIREMALGLVEPTRSWQRWDRTEAVDALQRFPDEHAVAVFETLLDDEDERVRRAAVRGLGIIGRRCPAAEARFQELLRDENVERRAVAIFILSDRPMTVDVILDARRLLDHREARIRAAALSVLARACKEFPEAHTAIREYEHDPDANIRYFMKVVKDPKSRWCPPPATGPAG